MKLALLRHGMTAWNLEKRGQGQIDQPLCTQGREQLLRLKLPPEYRAYRWFCSPLERALETAEILALAPIEVEPALIEMSWGDWEGEILKPLRRKLGEAMRANERRGLDFCPPNGESPRQVQRRLQRWLRRIARDGLPVAAIAHKGIVRCLYSLASGWDMNGEAPVEFAWDALHVFELTPDGRLLRQYEAVPLAG